MSIPPKKRFRPFLLQLWGRAQRRMATPSVMLAFLQLQRRNCSNELA